MGLFSTGNLLICLMFQGVCHGHQNQPSFCHDQLGFSLPNLVMLCAHCVQYFKVSITSKLRKYLRNKLDLSVWWFEYLVYELIWSFHLQSVSLLLVSMLLLLSSMEEVKLQNVWIKATVVMTTLARQRGDVTLLLGDEITLRCSHVRQSLTNFF